MTDFMLRTDTEAQMEDALEAAGILIEQEVAIGELALVPVANCAVDFIGPIPPEIDEDGKVTRPGDPRFHANLRVAFELTEEQVSWLPTFTPEPSIPYRVFA
jgi:hypothetical protein